MAATIVSGGDDHYDDNPVANRNTFQSPSVRRNSTTATDSHASPAQPKHQRFAVADPVAFRYLAQDRSTTVLERRRELQGYQCYVVEQWACSRRDPTLVIIAYTGNPSHTIVVGVLSVPGDETAWSPELKMYFKALTGLHARRRDTPAGSLMVTNLSGFPSSLTLVQVPDGDVTKHQEIFFVNENLKRLGCAGRAGLTITEPSMPTRAKFYQIYKISEKINFFNAIVELVKLCQAALVLFGQLEPEYADGLLCDVTERAVNDWWAEIGTQLHNVEPNDGVLGPTTIAALLGTLMGARNRLSVLGAPVSKDVFDLDITKKSISWFQKTQRISPRSRRFDSQTIKRLHSATAKQANAEGWTVPRAVKSTVAELSGKGGDMVMDAMGRGEKTSIADIETVDYDRFVHLVKGDRGKWLWKGTARKRTTRDMFSETFGSEKAGFRDDHDKATKDDRKPETAMMFASPLKKPSEKPRLPSYEEEEEDPRRSIGHLPPNEAEDGSNPGRRARALDKAKGKLKDVVTKRPHIHSQSKDSIAYKNKAYNRSAESLVSEISTGPPSPVEHGGRLSGFFDRKKDDAKQASRHTPHYAKEMTETPTSAHFPDNRGSVEQYLGSGLPFDFGEEILPATSIALSTRDTYQPCAELNVADHDRLDGDVGVFLRHRHSFSEYESISTASDRPANNERWPRQLSFSVVEDALSGHLDLLDDDPISTANPATHDTVPDTKNNPRLALLHELTHGLSLSHHRAHLSTLTHLSLIHI